MTVVTRFAPSPTGFLHIGGARTALFNYLYSRAKGGKYLLRIEDTDTKRSTQAAIDAIISGLDWLGLKNDGDIVFQSKNAERHRQVANELVAKGAAYKCYCTPQELDEMRKAAEAEGKNFKYPKIWRDKKESEAPAGVQPSIRIKAPLSGDVVINDLIRGEVRYPAEDLDDMVLLRADGTPTYMLAVVVDDKDMNVTHIIRGEDHLTNTFRQKMIYDAMGWQLPVTAHVPLIHGADGAKLSKRHGAQGVEEYRDMGYLPEAVNNYLMSLGWHYGDEETITMEDAIKRFDIANVGSSPSRFDFMKLNHINGIYLRKKSAEEILDLVWPFITARYKDRLSFQSVADLVFLYEQESEGFKKENSDKMIKSIAERSQTLIDFTDNCAFIFDRIPYTEKEKKAIEQGKEHIEKFVSIISSIGQFDDAHVKGALDDYGKNNGLKPGQYLPALRAAICGTMESPSLVLVILALGKDEVLKRMKNL